MAVTRTNYGTAQNETAATTVVLTTNAIIPANTLLVMSVCADNTSATAPVINSITNVGSGTWTNRAGSTTQSGASATAGSGVMVFAYTLFATTEISSGTAITITFNASPVAKTVVLHGYSEASGTLRNTVVSAGSTAGTPSAVTAGTALVAGDIVIGVLGSENSSVGTGDSDTLNGSWSAIDGIANSGGAAATNTAVGSQHKVVTATGAQTYNPVSSNDAVAIVFAMQPAIVPAVTQAAYRFYADGTETGSTALGTQDTAYTADLTSGDVNLGLRARLQETAGGTPAATDDWQLQYEKNASGTWTDVSSGALLDSYAETNSDFNYSLTVAGDIQGQSFLGNGKALKRAGFWAKEFGTAPGNVTAVLYAHSGAFGSGVGTGSVLATSTPRACASLTGAFQWEYFDFDGSFTPTNGTAYVIGLTVDTSTDGSNSVSMGADNTSATHAGNLTARTGGSWSSSSQDHVFRVYVAATVVDSYLSPNLTDGAATTNRLGAGTGTFSPGKVSTDGLVDDLGWTANNYTELLYSITLKKADLANSDVMRFRVLRNGATTGMTFTATPTVNVTNTVGTDFSGTATLTGDGSLSTTRTLTTGGTAALSGGGTLGTIQVPRPAVAAALSGDGTLSTAGVAGYRGTATFTGDGTLATTQVPRPTQTATLSGDGALATTQVPRPTGIVTLTGTGSLATVQVPRPVQIAALTGDGSLAAVGAPTVGTPIATITSQLFIGGVPVGSPVSHVLSTNAANVYAEFTVPGLTRAQLQSGTLTVRHIVTRANSTTSATVSVDSVELLADYQTTIPPGTDNFTGTATLSGSGTLATVQVPRPVGPAGLSGDGSLTTTQAPRPAVTVALSGDGSLSTTQVPRPTGTATLSGSGTLSTTQVPRTAVTVALSGAGTLSTTQAPRPVGTATLSGDGTLAAAVVVRVVGVATLSGSGTLTTTGGVLTPYDVQVLLDNPDIYYKMDETSGTTLVDSSPNGRPATNGTALVNQTPLFPNVGTSYDFDAVADVCTRPNQAWMVQTLFTVEALVRPDATSSYRCVFSRDGNAGSRGWTLYVHNGKIDFHTGSGDSDGVVTLLPGVAYHLCVTINSSTVKLYVNGVQDGSTLTRTIFNTAPNDIVIGASKAGTASFTFSMDGQISNVAHYSTELSAARVAAHYAALGAVTAFAGTATFSGSGTLGTTQAPRPAAAAALSGSGTLSTTQKPGPVGIAVLSGTGTLTTTVLVKPVVTVALTGTGTLSTVAIPRLATAVAFTGSGTLLAVGVVATEAFIGIIPI